MNRVLNRCFSIVCFLGVAEALWLSFAGSEIHLLPLIGVPLFGYLGISMWRPGLWPNTGVEPSEVEPPENYQRDLSELFARLQQIVFGGPLGGTSRGVEVSHWTESS